MNTNTPESKRRVHAVSELPRDVAPDRDLWPQIHARLAPRRRSWTLPVSLAASLLIAALGFVIGLHVRGTAPAQVASQDAGALIRTALLSPAYQSERKQLLDALPGKLKRLPPDAQQRVRDSLLAVQTAMRNIELELGRDAGNALLQELFISTCQEEVRVLTAVDAIGGSNQEI
jgi:AcrR family transcriptional regulator